MAMFMIHFLCFNILSMYLITSSHKKKGCSPKHPFFLPFTHSNSLLLKSNSLLHIILLLHFVVTLARLNNSFLFPHILILKNSPVFQYIPGFPLLHKPTYRKQHRSLISITLFFCKRNVVLMN